MHASLRRQTTNKDRKEGTIATRSGQQCPDNRVQDRLVRFPARFALFWIWPMHVFVVTIQIETILLSSCVASEALLPTPCKTGVAVLYTAVPTLEAWRLVANLGGESGLEHASTLVRLLHACSPCKLTENVGTSAYAGTHVLSPGCARITPIVRIPATLSRHYHNFDGVRPAISAHVRPYLPDRQIPFPEDSQAAGMMLRWLSHLGFPAVNSQCGLLYMRWTYRDISNESSAETHTHMLICAPGPGSENRLCKILQTHRRASRHDKAATPHTTWARLTFTSPSSVGCEEVIALNTSCAGILIREYNARGKIEEGVGGQAASTSLHGCITGRERANCRE